MSIPQQIEVGQHFGQLTVLSQPYRKNDYRVVDVACRCGVKKTVTTSKLLNGRTVSCGHARKQAHGNWGNWVFKKSS